MKNKKGVVLVIASVVIMVVTVLTSVYMTSMVTEKRSVDKERYVLQALNLAEAGANQAMAELRKRIITDLKTRVEAENKASVFTSYAASSTTALSLIRDYAYASGQTQFTVSGGVAALTVTPLDLNTGVAGNFATTTITIKAIQNPTANIASEIFTFYYSVSIESTGKITSVTPNITKTIAFSPKTFNLVIRRDNFAKYALFTSHHSTPSGTTVWFTASTTFTGPVHTNDRFSFANNPSGHFTNDVTQKETRTRYYNNGNTVLADAAAYPIGCTTSCVDKPVFDTSFTRGVDLINLPSSITQTELKNEALGTMSNPGSTPAVYVPNNGTSCTGGIFINGSTGSSSDDATVVMSSDGNKAVYTISQNVSCGAHCSTTNTYVIKVDFSANTTSYQLNGGTTTTYTGKPDGVDDEGILIYANDSIKSISGVVQKDSQVTVSGEKDIIIGGNIKYEEYNASPLSATGYTNLMGILSWAGDIRIGTTAPNNVEIHSVLMAPHGQLEVDNYDSGSSRGIATILGGAITDFYGPFGTFSGSTSLTGFGRNFVYDSRVLSGMAPPYFPYMTNFTSALSPSNALYQKLIWREK